MKFLVTASEHGLSRASDEALLQLARNQKRILVTLDRDYGALAFVKSLGAGGLPPRCVLPGGSEPASAGVASLTRQLIGVLVCCLA